MTTGPWTPPKPCIIATATFGSEVSSAVQFLRNFRDGLVLSTRAGSAFMEVFNAWYYSFSPSVAGFIAGNDPLRAPIRVLLYPLLGILGVSSLAYSLLSGVPEFAIVVAGLAASSLIGLVYLTLPAMFGVRALLKRRRVRLVGVAKGSAALLTVALALLAVGEVTGSFLLLAIGGSATVLTCLIAAPAIFAFAMLHPNPE
ncbi:MAG: CFI-box-CTERM domain-containing protein [Candidatus Bathyarchaeia archaeon]